MKKKFLVGLLSAAMVATMLTGCGKKADTSDNSAPTTAPTQEATADEGTAKATTDDAATSDSTSTGDIVAKSAYHFEIVSKGFQSTYWQAVYKGASAEAEKLGVTINMVGPNSESDIADQVQMLNSAVNAKPAAIGLASLDTKAALDAITAAQNANIPIIGFDSGVPAAPEGAVYANASTDNYKAGAVAADGMYDGIKDRVANASGPVRIGVVNQDATSESICNRGLGFIDEMITKLSADGKTAAVVGNDYYVQNVKSPVVDEKSANVIIEVRVPSQTTTELTAIEASTILNQKDTIAIFGSNQTAAEGVVTANDNLSVLGTGEGQIIGVGFDSGSVLKAAVTSGTLYGAVTQAPVSIGQKMVDLLVQVANGETVSNVDTGCQWYNKDNIASEEIAQNLYD
ncbi:substrate-binding domain-containing protein [Anaerocolumna sp. MB42-C2]|uniref:substrate-binding domain-containing protein n=1 Tax=Anaerocolumna sp. MB42-C2 TaxID=3070997 RepID=UPI0027DF70B8|nr:substrate-binding domain-containing protein [Anaerocolumna sp. MB42-C2]WMJ89993.1 substrate-binding domain-containing protein [Anaerocolumna sp. MB42-C2]